MKKIPVLPYIASILAIVLLFSLAPMVSASISGDEVCGKWNQALNGGKGAVENPCTVDVIGKILKGILTVIIALGIPLTFIFIASRFVMAWFALQQGNPNAYKEALKKSLNAMLGFFMIVALFGGGLMLFLKYFGVKDEPLKLLRILSVSSIVERAYAADCSRTNLGQACTMPNGSAGKCSAVDRSASASAQNISYECVPPLIIRTTDANGNVTGLNPNPDVVNNPAYQNQLPTSGVARDDGLLPNFFVSDDIYDLILSAVRLVVRFFLYPALIVIWVWTGFSFVLAQGAPDALNRAKKWLMWAFITTLVVFMLQAFLAALRGTVEKILPGSTTQVQVTPSGNTNAASAVTGAVGSSSTIEFCKNKTIGELCSVTVAGGTTAVGVCDTNSDGIKTCYKAVSGMTCLTSQRAYGKINASGDTCIP